MHYLYLLIAIVSEVIGTTALKSSNEFRRLIPSIIVVIGFGSAFFFLSKAIRKIPVAHAYAIWSGVGILLIAVAAAIIHREKPDAAALLGMALIVAGVVVLNLFSEVQTH